MNNYIASLGTALANHLWQSTAFGLLAWLLTLALSRNQARVRYAIWLTASIKFLIPFSLLVSAGSLLPHPRQTVAPIVYSTMDIVEEPFAVPDVSPASSPAYVPTLRERVKVDLPAGIAVLWAIGFCTVLFGWWNRWRIVFRSARSAVSTTEGREFEILRRLEDGACPLPLFMSVERMEPGIFGAFRPILVWPQRLSLHLDDQHIEAIVAHELMHVRRRDNLTALLHMVVEAVFWFHPLVWWMERQMVKEREQACDEAVVAMGGSAEIYAESLLKTCWFCVELPLACVAGVTGADIKRRVAHIISGRVLLQMTWPQKFLLASAGLCVIVAPIVLGEANPVRRLTLAAVKAAPRPLQIAAQTPNTEKETLPGEKTAEVQLTTASSGRTSHPAASKGELVGNWQGILKLDGGESRRLVLEITEDGGKYKGVFFPIDQGPGGTAMSLIALDGAEVSFQIKTLDWTYRGTLSAEGSAISGSRMQNGHTNVLNLNRATAKDAWAIPGPPKTMVADAVPKFEVVTAKPSNPARPGDYFTFRGRQMITVNTTVNELITFAYGLHPKQLLGGPDWLQEKFDLDGVPDVEGEPNEEQMRLLVRDALVTRFRLKLHHEQRELSVYVLNVAKSGPKITVTAAAPSAAGNFFFRGGMGRLHVTNSTMKSFCKGMQEAVMDKPVIDHTGLTERYDFKLNWAPDESQFAQMGGYRPPPQEDPNAPPGLYAAIQEQLGLKLETTKAMADVMVIDHIEKPREN